VALVGISLIALTALAAWELDRIFSQRMAELKANQKKFAVPDR
jgi:hypothetical protein